MRLRVVLATNTRWARRFRTVLSGDLLIAALRAATCSGSAWDVPLAEGVPCGTDDERRTAPAKLPSIIKIGPWRPTRSHKLVPGSQGRTCQEIGSIRLDSRDQVLQVVDEGRVIPVVGPDLLLHGMRRQASPTASRYVTRARCVTLGSTRAATAWSPLLTTAPRACGIC